MLKGGFQSIEENGSLRSPWISTNFHARLISDDRG